MYSLIIVFCAVMPAIVLMAWIYKKDKLQKEPLSQILKGFGYGALAVVMSASIEQMITMTGLIPDMHTSIAGALGNAFIVAALTEESVKLLMLYVLIRHNKYFDEHFDGIVYAASVGLGFAAFENIGYIFGDLANWQGIAIGRALLSVPLHFLCAVVMGYFVSISFFGKDKKRNMLRAFYIPILLHGTYDGIIMVCGVENMHAVYIILLEGFLIFFLIKLWKQGLRRIEMHLRQDQQVLEQYGSFDSFAAENGPADVQLLREADKKRESADDQKPIPLEEETQTPVEEDYTRFMPKPTTADAEKREDEIMS